MPRDGSDERTGQTGVSRACCGSGLTRPINQSGGHAQMSSGLESQAGFHAEAGYTHASVAGPQPPTNALTSGAGPYTVHRRFVHSTFQTRRDYTPTRATQCANAVWSDLAENEKEAAPLPK